MLPLKRILCPTDFSSDARSALRVANEMALYFSANLTLVHVVPPATAQMWPVDGYRVCPVGVDPSPENTLKHDQESLSEEAHDFISRDVFLTLEVLQGDPADEILKLARETDCDMIVMATHGHSRFRKALLGSTAEKVLRLSTCPVITLHGGQETTGVKEPLQAEEAEI